MPAQRLIETMMVELTNATESDIPGEIFCLQAMFTNYTGTFDIDPLMAYKATSDSDTMYMHQAMKQPD